MEIFIKILQLILSLSIPGEVGRHLPAEGAVSLPDRERCLRSTATTKTGKFIPKSVLIRNDQLCRRCHDKGEAVMFDDLPFLSALDWALVEPAMGLEPATC